MTFLGEPCPKHPPPPPSSPTSSAAGRPPARQSAPTLTDAAGPVIAKTLSRAFLRTRTDKVAELLATLAAIGQAREAEPGTYCG
ncbi:hypothetical protein [Geobacter sp.]|uniref:hypothetical protein n=1 Tax=Geobacter sp. TaxID=46610 RepID=UPI0027BA877C|nr:hypothetical protein [Geobacter sp.]